MKNKFSSHFYIVNFQLQQKIPAATLQNSKKKKKINNYSFSPINCELWKVFESMQKVLELTHEQWKGRKLNGELFVLKIWTWSIGLDSVFLFFHCTHNITRMQLLRRFCATEAIDGFCYVASTNTMHGEATPFGNRIGYECNWVQINYIKKKSRLKKGSIPKDFLLPSKNRDVVMQRKTRASIKLRSLSKNFFSLMLYLAF